MPKYVKPVRPFPNRADSLWRGCIFALAAGWDKGATVGMRATPEDQWKERGTIGGSISGVYTIKDLGRALSNGTSDDNIAYSNIQSRFDLGVAEPQITAAVLVRPNTGTANDHLEVMTNRDSDGVANDGWNLELRNTLTDPWAFEICNGVTENRAQSTVDGVAERTDLLVGTFNEITNLIKMFINGALNVSAATTIALPDNGNNISLFAFLDNNVAHILPGNIGMAGVWKRELTTQEIARLHTDPYVMWKPKNKSYMFGPGMGEVAARRPDFFLSF